MRVRNSTVADYDGNVESQSINLRVELIRKSLSVAARSLRVVGKHASPIE